MSDRKKPGKNSSRRGKKKPAVTVVPADGVSGFNAIPSPFLRAGFDIGVDLSAPRRQSSKTTAALVTTGDVSGQADAPGQADATNTPTPDPTITPDSSAAASAKKSGLQTPKKGSTGISKKQARALKALGLEEEEEDVTTATKKAKAPKASRAVKTPQGSKAQNKAAATPKKPKEDKKTTTPLKVTPSKRPHDASIPDVSYWSSTYPYPIVLSSHHPMYHLIPCVISNRACINAETKTTDNQAASPRSRTMSSTSSLTAPPTAS